MIIVQATTYIAEQSRDRFVELTRKTMLDSLAEDGCIAYTCAPDLDDPTAFHWFEAWRDDAAFAAHHRAVHHQNYVANLDDPRAIQRVRPAVGRYLQAAETTLDAVLAAG
jgi:quinol monooxygenase YgiN